MKKLFALTALLAVCLTVTSCGDKNSLSEDTAAAEQSTEQASEAAQSEETMTETTETTAAETKSLEDLSDYDKAVRLAAEHIEENGADHWKYILYDFDLDGIPELMEETGFMDTLGWNIYKLTGSEAENLGCMEFAGSIDRYINGDHDIIYYHGDELTLESGVHVYRDTENDEIFYVTEYTTELHTEGRAVGSRYDIYADRMTQKELYHCDFLTYDDCGESGNRYILRNILDGKNASPMYRCNCNSEGFLYCNEFGDYLSGFEYLGMIDTENYYTKQSGSSFYDYAQTVRIPERTRAEQAFSGSMKRVTVCGKEYSADSYEASIYIDENNYDSIDLSELALLPCLERLELINRSGKTVDISPIAGMESLIEIDFFQGAFDYSSLAEMDNIICLKSYSENIPIEVISEMPSLKVIYADPYTDGIDGYAPLYDMEQLEVVMHNVQLANEMTLDRLSEHRPDLLLIYVP